MFISVKLKCSVTIFVQIFFCQAVLSLTTITYAQSFIKVSDLKNDVNFSEFIVTAKSELILETEGSELIGDSTSEKSDNKDKSTPDNKSAEHDNSVYWIAPGLALGAVVLAGIASGSGNSGNDSGSAKHTITFKSPIRIGDDRNYNEEHSDNFKISTPSGITYSESFQISSNVLKGTLLYTIAGATMANRIYINESLVGRTCNPGNTAYVVEDCPPIDVTSQLKAGANILKIASVVYPGDEITPYDDIEIYNMRLDVN
jgi:hypothetical protein